MLIFHHNFISPKEKQEHKSTDLSWRLYCVPHKTKLSKAIETGCKEKGKTWNQALLPLQGTWILQVSQSFIAEVQWEGDGSSATPNSAKIKKQKDT